jgi:hypothetical protein
MSDAEHSDQYHPEDPDQDPLRRHLPDEVYAAEADYVRLAMKEMTARRMIGWLRAAAGYFDVSGHTASAEHARHVANRLAAEVEPESIEEVPQEADDE